MQMTNYPHGAENKKAATFPRGLYLKTHSALALEACVPTSQDRDIAQNVPNHCRNLFHISDLCKSHIDLHQFIQRFDGCKDGSLRCHAHNLRSVLAEGRSRPEVQRRTALE